jgi:uncharacterized protein
MTNYPSLLSRLLRFILALAIGTVGGAIFNYFNMPLAWMLGAMTACTAAAIAGVAIVAFEGIRPFMTAVIGVLLGAGFSPDLLGGLLGWVPSLVGLLIFILAGALIGTLYFHKVAQFDLPTAFFAAMPGGLIEMMTLGAEKGGDGRLIALVHSARILLVVASLPYVLMFLFDVDLSALRPSGRTSVLETPLTDELWLIACTVVGMVLGRVLRLPAKYLLGPMLLSAAVHMSGVSDFQPAMEVVIVAQLFLGTLVGCRFAGMSAKLVLKIILLSVGSVIMLLIAAATAAVVLSRVSPYGPEALLLAYSPGGLTEMSLVALSMGIEVAFVAGHHIIRVLLVLLVASVTFGAVVRR